MLEHTWTIVHDEPNASVRRIAVPGGWLYQVERADWSESQQHAAAPEYQHGWHAPVFVPAEPCAASKEQA